MTTRAGWRNRLQAVAMSGALALLGACSFGGSAPPEPVAAPEPVPAKTAAAPVPAGPTKVALLVPLTGNGAPIGTAMLNAAQLALFDIAGENFELVPIDTQGTSSGAAAAMRQAVDEQKVRLVLGPLFGDDVTAVKPIAAQANINVVSFTNNDQLAGGNVFTMGFSPAEQVDRVIGYARRNGITRFGGVAPQNPYGETVASALTRATQRNGAELVRLERYSDPAGMEQALARATDFDARRTAMDTQRQALAGRTDPASQMALQRANAQQTYGAPPIGALLLPAGGQELVAMGGSLQKLGLPPSSIRLLGTGLWDDPATGQAPQLVGGWFAVPPPEARGAFESRFTATYGAPPPRLATLAYDATALAALIGRNGKGYTKAAITDRNGFTGVDGIFRFNADGRVERGLAVVEVIQGGTRTIDPAPQSFVGVN